MNEPNYLDYCTDDIEELYYKLQDNVLKTVAKRIIKYGAVTPSSWQQIKILEESGLVYEDVISILSEFTQLSQIAVQDMFNEAKVACIKFDNEICREAGIPLLKENGSPAVNQIVRAAITKTNGNLANLTMTTADAAQNKFIDACSVAEMEINTGAFDVNTALRHAVEFAAQDGLDVYFYNDDEDGSVRTAKRNVVSAVRTAVLTGVSQTTGEISLEDAKLMGTDLMELSAHIGARPSHSLWQGKIVCISNRATKYLTLIDIGYGEIDGFKGINCRHNWFPFLEGVSKRTYTDEQLEEMNNATVNYNGSEIPLYKATQRQRAMERQIRDERRQLVFFDNAIKEAKNQGMFEIAEDLKVNFDNVSLKLKAHETMYKDYCKQTGLPELSERLQYPSFNRSVSQKAVHSVKGLYNTAKGVINPEIMPKTVEEFEKICYNPQREMLSELSQLSYEDALKVKPLFNERVVRSWYIYHNKNIANLIDQDLLIEDKAIQAFNYRNKYKEQARSLMLNEKAKQQLDEEEPILTFAQLMAEKAARKQIAGVELYNDIIKSSGKTRKSVNKKYGLED